MKGLKTIIRLTSPRRVWRDAVLGHLIALRAELPLQLGALRAVLNRIESKLDALTVQEVKMDQSIVDALAQLNATVSTDTDVTSSAVTLLNALTAKIDELLASSTNPAEVVAAIQAVNETFKANTNTLAAGVAANTPAAPSA